jgi:HTH-type transcriptional regulator, competence development regulator
MEERGFLMTKKSAEAHPDQDRPSPKKLQPLGEYLRSLREYLKLTLREVQEASEVSNAYLSQLENGKITKPSPHILHKLAAVYNEPYETLMEKAGYIGRSAEESIKTTKKHRTGRLAALVKEELTQEEEEELLRYLAYLRSKKG